MPWMLMRQKLIDTYLGDYNQPKNINQPQIQLLLDWWHLSYCSNLLGVQEEGKKRKLHPTKNSNQLFEPQSSPPTWASVAWIYSIYTPILTFSTFEHYWTVSRALFPVNIPFQPVITYADTPDEWMFTDKTDEGFGLCQWLLASAQTKHCSDATASEENKSRMSGLVWKVQCGSRIVHHRFCWWSLWLLSLLH